MTGRLILAVITVAMLAANGCQSDKPRDDADDFAGRTYDYSYDKFGFQVDPKTGEKIDASYNRRLEKVIGR